MALLCLLGFSLILAARLLIPQAPPLYDGITVQAEPYHYVSPPPDLASSNKLPTAGEGDVPIENGSNKIATVETADQQVLIFFNKGTLGAAGATSIHVTITPVQAPPPPPAGAKYVGNDYRITASGRPDDIPVQVKGPLQVLLRVPPVALSSVMVSDGTWHRQDWRPQQDFLNVDLTRFGDLAAFDSGQHRTNPPQQQRFSIAGIIEIALVLVALGIIVAGVVVQTRRGRAKR